MKYISSNVLVNEVKNMLTSYVAAQKLDNTVFYPPLKECLDMMGYKVLPTKRIILNVSNYKAPLPEGVTKIQMAILCESAQVCEKHPTKWEANQTVICEQDLQVIGECYGGQWSVALDTCGNMTAIVERTQTEVSNFTRYTALHPGPKAKTRCSAECFDVGARSTDEFEIQTTQEGDIFLTSFPSGIVFLEYLSSLEGDTEFLVPDNVFIRKWIKSAMIQAAFQYLWFNGEDVERKLTQAKIDYATDFANAYVLYQRSEISAFYKAASNLRQRFARMKNILSVT